MFYPTTGRVSISVCNSKMLIFHFNRYHIKNSNHNQNNINKNIFYLILIYQIYTTTVLTCVNCENLIKTNIRFNSNDMSLIGSAAAAAAGDAETDEQNSNLYINSNSNNISNNSITNNNNIICGNTQKMADNCFRDLPPHLMEFLQTSKIPINEQDIISKCK